MPLGLVERDWRAADLAARALLGTRRGSVFLVAPRAVWEVADTDDATATDRCRALTGGGLSRQAWALSDSARAAGAVTRCVPRGAGGRGPG